MDSPCCAGLCYVAPYTISRQWTSDSQSRTQRMLDIMFKSHQPERWYFGHHHHAWQMPVNGTNFRCLTIDELVEAELP